MGGVTRSLTNLLRCAWLFNEPGGGLSRIAVTGNWEPANIESLKTGCVIRVLVKPGLTAPMLRQAMSPEQLKALAFIYPMGHLGLRQKLRLMPCSWARMKTPSSPPELFIWMPGKSPHLTSWESHMIFASTVQNPEGPWLTAARGCETHISTKGETKRIVKRPAGRWLGRVPKA